MSGGPGATIRRHPSEATVVAYAAGSLWEAAGHVVQAHLSLCSQCRSTFDLAEAIGGACLDELPPTPLAPEALGRVAERLRGSGKAALPVKGPFPVAAKPAAVPEDLRGVRLRWLAPGVRHAVLLRGLESGTLRLLRVRSGVALPRHTHRGAELTLVLEGAFTDETGRYGPGEFAEAESDVSHQPLAEGPSGCICLIATEGRLRFGGLLGAIFGVVARV